MLCPKPSVGPTGQFPCGQCVACRINRQRAWAARILLEAKAHHASLFLTLTYDWEHVPGDAGGCGLNLVPEDRILFLKRLRERLRPRTIRYFSAGEYGADPNILPPDQWPDWLHEAHQPRPHWHLVIFGLSLDECVVVNGRLQHPTVQEAWGKGFTEAGELTAHRAAYVAGYVTKKLASRDCAEARRLYGRRPEHATQSKNPGIGALYVDELAEALLHAAPDDEDIPEEWHDQATGRTWPLTPFVAGKVREALGLERLARNRPPRDRRQKPDDEDVVPGLYRQEVDAYAGTVQSVPLTRKEVRAREAAEKATRRAKRNMARRRSI